MLSRSLNNSNVLGLLFMLPAAILLLIFLAYQLGMGVWLGSTDTRLGNTGHWIGLGNYIYLMYDLITQLALFNTIFYTVVARDDRNSVVKGKSVSERGDPGCW